MCGLLTGYVNYAYYTTGVFCIEGNLLSKILILASIFLWYKFERHRRQFCMIQNKLHRH